MLPVVFHVPRVREVKLLITQVIRSLSESGLWNSYRISCIEAERIPTA